MKNPVASVLGIDGCIMPSPLAGIRQLSVVWLAFLATVVPLSAEAVQVTVNEIARYEYDFTGDPVLPDYGSVTVSMGFAPTDLLDPLEALQIQFFDSVNTPIGYWTYTHYSLAAPTPGLSTIVVFSPPMSTVGGYALISLLAGSIDIEQFGLYMRTGDNLNPGQTTSLQYAASAGITPVPLPAVAWLLLSGVAALGTIASRRNV